MKVKVLSVRQPWAWCIINANKNIENRTWKTNYKGELYIHASNQFDYGSYAEIISTGSVELPSHIDEFRLGGIIGKVHLVGCFQNQNSFWSETGKYHWRLEKPEALTFFPCKGQLRIFEVNVNYHGC